MNNNVKVLFDNLNEYWGKPDKQLALSCGDIQQKILGEIRVMCSDDVVKLINELTDAQINQIIAILEEIIILHPQTIPSLRCINRERKIYLLNDELRFLKLI